MSNTKKPANVKAMLKKAKLPKTVVPICLRPDLVAEITRLDNDLDEQESPRRQPARLAATGDADRSGVEAAARRIEELREEMRANTIDVELQAHRRSDWTARTVAHPPRQGNRVDQAQNVNTDTFWPVVIREAIVDPQLDDEDWQNFQDAVAGGEWEKLMDAVFDLNRKAVDIPFSRRASQILQTASGGSEPPAPSA